MKLTKKEKIVLSAVRFAVGRTQSSWVTFDEIVEQLPRGFTCFIREVLEDLTDDGYLKFSIYAVSEFKDSWSLTDKSEELFEEAE